MRSADLKEDKLTYNCFIGGRYGNRLRYAAVVVNTSLTGATLRYKEGNTVYRNWENYLQEQVINLIEFILKIPLQIILRKLFLSFMAFLALNLLRFWYELFLLLCNACLLYLLRWQACRINAKMPFNAHQSGIIGIGLKCSG